MLVATCTQSQGDPIWKSLLVLKTGGGVDLLLVFLALRVGRERLLKSVSQTCMSFWPDFGFIGNEKWGVHTRVTNCQEHVVRMGQDLFGSGLSLVFSSPAVTGDNVTASFQIQVYQICLPALGLECTIPI